MVMKITCSMYRSVFPWFLATSSSCWSGLGWTAAWSRSGVFRVRICGGWLLAKLSGVLSGGRMAGKVWRWAVGKVLRWAVGKAWRWAVGGCKVQTDRDTNDKKYDQNDKRKGFEHEQESTDQTVTGRP